MLTLCGTKLRAGVDGLRRRRHAHAGVATDGQPDGRNPGAGGGRRSPHQTAPILLKLAEQYGRFGGDTKEEQFEILRWLFWDNHKLTAFMATYRFQRTFTPSPDPHVLTYLRKRLDDFLSILDQHLQRNAFAIGARPTIADFSMMAYLSFPGSETGYDFASSHPALRAWLDRIAALPGWNQPTTCCRASASSITSDVLSG